MTEWKIKALEYREQGLSSRKICEKLGWSKTKKTTINDFFKRHDIEHGAAMSLYERSVELKKSPVVCYLDIECSPTKSYIWRRWKENINQSQILSESFFLTSSWAFNDRKVESMRLTPNEAVNEDDEALIACLWGVLDNSNVVVGHNLRRFDIKKINARFAYYGFKPPSPYKIIDTLEIAKSRFAFPSNKLNDLCEYLGIGEKLPHDGFDLWKRCCAGSVDALEHMEKYNKVDVELTRELYKRLRGYDNNAVNMAIMSDNVGSICTTCCSDDISVLEGKYTFTPNGKYQVYACNNCGTKLRSTSRVGEGNKLVRVV